MQRSVKKIRTMDGRQTSMALEPVYWTAIQRLSSRSGLTWKQWTEQQISKAPASGAAGTLRGICLQRLRKRPETRASRAGAVAFNRSKHGIYRTSRK